MSASQRREAIRLYPHWMRDVDAHLPICAQFILHGNVRDDHLVPEEGHLRFRSTVAALSLLLLENGYAAVLTYDPIAGLRSTDPAQARSLLIEMSPTDDWIAPTAPTEPTGQALSTERLTQLLALIQPTSRPQHRIGLIMDYVSQLTPSGEHLSEAHHSLFRTALQRVHTTQRTVAPDSTRAPLFNPVFWIVDRPGDLPGWLVSAPDGIHQVPIPTPDQDTRQQAAEQLARGQEGLNTAPGPMADDDIATFADLTDRMTLRAMREIVRLAQDQDIVSADIADAIRMYRVGLLDNPWGQETLKEKIAGAEATLSEAVLGQPSAIHRSLDILMRSSTGLTSAHTGGRATGPRGVLFLAGPTGVGKTELAKHLTRVVFGSPDAYVRFDMSEFSHEGSDLRLMGAPPGYVGHEAGGELTNAIRQRPFSLILFDEIEKADQKIMDKFLQILSDGRLTDGAGATVDFSESLLIFTSNKGMADPLPNGELPHPDLDYDDLEKHVLGAIKRHFTETLGRPEILNRLGDNIVVFDYIRADVALKLLHNFVDNALTRVKELHNIDVTLTESAWRVLVEECTSNREMGGRGIGQRVESVLTNPLARAVFFHNEPDRAIQITNIVREVSAWALVQD